MKKVIPSLLVPGSVQRLEDFARNEQGELDAAIAKELAQPLPLDFRRSDYSDVIAFFEEASYDYDSDMRNPYWAFSHEILKFILTHHIRSHFGANTPLRVFDAGAGTGNWSNFVLGLSTQAQGILFDMNSAMLSQAFPKVRSLSGNVVRIREGNLEVRADYPRDASNLILCMHNVIGMGRNSARILRNLADYLEPGGLAFIMAMNKYHALTFNQKYRSQLEVARVVHDGTVKFKSDMPEMFCYTPEELKALLGDSGFDEVTVLGFPVTLYPTVEDAKLLRTRTPYAELLNPHSRSRLIEDEKRLCLNPWLAYRGGSSLIAIAKKRTG